MLLSCITVLNCATLSNKLLLYYLGRTPVSCKQIKKQNPEARSGVHIQWIEEKPKTLVCEKGTEGGGWTLVYSYKSRYVIFFSVIKVCNRRYIIYFLY